MTDIIDLQARVDAQRAESEALYRTTMQQVSRYCMVRDAVEEMVARGATGADVIEALRFVSDEVADGYLVPHGEVLISVRKASIAHDVTADEWVATSRDVPGLVTDARRTDGKASGPD